MQGREVCACHPSWQHDILGSAARALLAPSTAYPRDKNDFTEDAHSIEAPSQLGQLIFAFGPGGWRSCVFGWPDRG